MKIPYSKTGFPKTLRARDASAFFRLPAAVFFLLSVLAPYAAAVPAAPEPAELSQADGGKVKVFLKGDEFYSWHEDEAGYTITKDTDTGNWVYFAKDPRGSLRKTAHKAGKADPAQLGLTRHLLDAGRVSAARARRNQRDARNSRRALPASSVFGSALSADGPRPALMTQGTIKNLVILVRFSDQTTTYSQAQFDALFNETGYTADGASGSVKDYYHEVSYNKLTVQSVVTEWVTLPHTQAYYGADYGGDGNDARPREMVAEAIDLLEASGFDFRQADGNNDGLIDGLDIIHSGMGQEYSGNSADCIWSHQWEMIEPLTRDGVTMSSYHTEPEIRGWSSSPSTQGIARIGVICHETGHFLGLPDLYDYGGDSQGVGHFCLMAGGSWNGIYGTIPAPMSAWCKKRLDWVTPATLSSAGNYSLAQIETSSSAVYKFSGAGFASTEYFLTENKQNYGFEAGLPGSIRGMLIWHIDETVPDWGANDDQTHYKVDLEEAGGTQHLALNVNSGDDGDYFRNTTMASFGDSTSPDGKSYTGSGLGWYLRNISASGNPMTFDLLVPDSTPPSAIASVFDGVGADISFTTSRTQLSANWTASSDDESGIFRYLYAIGTTPGGTQKLGWTGNGLNLSVTRPGLSLTSGRTYYISVKAENSQGLTSAVATSNGQTVDTSAPLKPVTVNDGTGADIVYTTAAAQLSANWTPGFDPESGIAKYWYAIGIAPGGTTVSGGWLDNGVNTFVTRTGLSLTRSQMYYFTVKAENQAGLQSTAANSNGQRMDNTPLTPAFVQVNYSSLTVTWTAISGENYSVALSSDVNFTNILSSAQQSDNSSVFTGLTAATQYFVKVRLSGEPEWDHAGNMISTATLGILPGLPAGPAFSQISAGSMTVSWSSGTAATGYNPVNTLYQAEISPAAGFSPVFGSSLTYNLSAVFTGLAPGTSYFARVQAAGYGGAGPFTELGAAVTLAAAPAGSEFLQVHGSSAVMQWSGSGNPPGITYEAQYWTAGGSTTSLAVDLTSAVLTGLTRETTVYARVRAFNDAGIPTAYDTVISTFIPNTQAVIRSTGVYTLVYDQISLNIQPDTFSETATVLIKRPDIIPPDSGGLESFASRVLVDISAQTSAAQRIQPSNEVTITADYGAINLAGADEDTLVIATYNDGRAVWVPLYSTRDKTAKKVRATTGHFSLFQLMHLPASGGIQGITVGPNPLRPLKDPGASFTFRHLPSGASVKIYTYLGELLRETAADASGLAVWDGKNIAGRPVASDLYLALVQWKGEKKIFKLVVEK